MIKIANVMAPTRMQATVAIVSLIVCIMFRELKVLV